MTSATGWSWGSAWGDDALDDQEDEAGGRVKNVWYACAVGVDLPYHMCIYVLSACNRCRDYVFLMSPTEFSLAK